MLAADEEAYEAYFKWRDDPEEEKRFQEVRESICEFALGVQEAPAGENYADKKLRLRLPQNKKQFGLENVA